MEFLDKRHRAVVMAIAQGGPAGVDRDDLTQGLSLIMSRDTISKILEDLYFDGSISVLRDGTDIRYVASKEIRESMIVLELQRYRLAKKLERLREISKAQEKNKPELVINSLREVFILISNSIANLLKSSPSITIPEYLDTIDTLSKDFLSKLTPLLEEKPSTEELEFLIKLVSRFRGEKDAEKLKTVLDKLSQAKDRPKEDEKRENNESEKESKHESESDI